MSDDDTPDVPDFLPEDIDDPDENEEPARVKMSEIIDMVTEGSPFIDLEQVKKIGGEPLTEEEVEGLEPEHQAAMLYTERTLASLLSASNHPPVADGLTERGQHVMAEGIRRHTEIMVRLHRIRMREEIKVLRGQSDGRW
jgi:hypothetical protein